MLVVGFLIVVLPVLREFAGKHIAFLDDYGRLFKDLRIFTGTVVLAAILFAIHYWLPAGRRRLIDIWPGILHTMALWLVAGTVYSQYLAYYNFYASTYAGLANVMIALFFFFITAVIFVFGAELNRAIIEDRDGRSGAPDEKEKPTA